MKAYLSLAIGALWFIATAILRRRTPWSFFWRSSRAGAPDPVTIAIFRIVPPLFNFGWIAPVSLGIWLLWANR